MKIGFTGTQQGMTDAQANTTAALIQRLDPEEAHHGDCIGADAEFHRMCRLYSVKIVRHPPIKTDKRSFCDFDLDRLPQDHLVRNRDIVREVDVLIATPRSNQEEVRSGTWATIRHAEDAKVPRYIVWPDGSIKEER